MELAVAPQRQGDGLRRGDLLSSAESQSAARNASFSRWSLAMAPPCAWRTASSGQYTLTEARALPSTGK